MSKLGKKIVYHLITYDTAMEMLGDKGINEEYFLHEAKDAFIYVRDNILKGRKPTINEVETKLGEKLKSVDEGDIEYLTEDIKKRYVSGLVNPHIEEAIKKLEEAKPEEAINLLLEVGEYRKHLENRTTMHSFKEGGEERFEDYLNIKHKSGVTGIPSRWKAINEACGGYVDGEFTVIAAFTNVGKTWALCIIAEDIINHLEPDECILLVSTEMRPIRVIRRIECVKHKINFESMRKGELEDIEEDDWMDLIAQAQSNSVDYADVHAIGKKDCNNVAQIKMLCKELNPKAVLVDGGYRLEPSAKSRSMGHEKQVTVIREIQDACLETELPWIITAQVGEVDEKKKGSMGNTYGGIKYAKEWVIDPDNVFFLRQTEDHKAEKRMVFTNYKLREGTGDNVGKAWQTHWNPDEMNYDDLDDSDVYKPAGAGTATFDDDDDDDLPPPPPVDPTSVMP